MDENNQVSATKKILLTDDDNDFRWVVANVLISHGYEVLHAENGSEALKVLEKEIPNLVLLDYRMPGEDGIKVASKIRKIIPSVPIIIITAYADVRSAVEAMKLGVYDYVTKPIDNNDLFFTVKRAIEKHDLSEEVEYLRRVLSDRSSLYEAMGRSDQVVKIANLVEKVAPTSFTVLLEGESGTGKEIVARAIHDLSKVKDGPFIAVDCGAIPEGLIESELFGYVKGAFTGAGSDKSGQFELADGGTLFLDETGNLSYPAQQKLLRTMQERRIQRLGAKKSVPVRVRIIAATNRSLDKDVEKGSFRADLYYRINEFFFSLPSLRERKEDIPYLMKKFMDEAKKELKKNCTGVSKEAYRALISYHWPGNVRELRNIVRQAVLLCEENAAIETEHLMFDTGLVSDTMEIENSVVNYLYSEEKSLKETIQHYTDQLEKNIITTVLRDSKGNKSKTAKKLCIDYKTLYRKIKMHQIE